MFLERSRGVFVLRLFWRSGLWLSHFLRKQGLWKSTLHQLLLNHPVVGRAGAAGPEWGSAAVQSPAPSLGLARLWEVAGDRGQSPWEMRPPCPRHHLLLCPKTLACDCGGGERAAFRSPSAKGIPLGVPSGRRQEGEGGRRCGSPGWPPNLCGQVSHSQPVLGLELCLCLAACISVDLGNCLAFVCVSGCISGSSVEKRVLTCLFAYVCVHISMGAHVYGSLQGKVWASLPLHD